MLAMQLSRPAPAHERPLELVSRDTPIPAANELVLEVVSSAVCRTDLQICEGDLKPRRTPVIPGHQVVGRVVALGRHVGGWAVGERAGVAWLAGVCGHCE